MLVLIGGSILGLEIKGDLVARDKTPLHPRSPPARAPCHPSLPRIFLCPPVPQTPILFLPAGFAARMSDITSQLTCRAQIAKRSQEMEWGGGWWWKRGTAFLSSFSTEEPSTAWAQDGCAGAAEMQFLGTAPHPYLGKPASLHRRTRGRPDPPPPSPTF